MSRQRALHLEQALLAVLAVLAAVVQHGCPNDICAQAAGLLMSERKSHWADSEYKNGAADEIELALILLIKKLRFLDVSEGNHTNLVIGNPG